MPETYDNSLALVYDVAYPFVEGGGQKRMYEIATRLLRRDWKVTWYTAKTWEGPDVLHENGITYVGLPSIRSYYTASGRRSIPQALSFGKVVWRARHKIRQHSVLWCGQWPYFHLFALALFYRGTFVVDWWETWGKRWSEYLGVRGAVGRLIETVAARLFSRRGTLVNISESGMRDVIRAGARPEGTRLIHNGVDLKAIARIVAAQGGADIIYAGRLKDHKNVDHILSAAVALRRSTGRDISVQIIGDGPERATLGDLAEQLGLQGSVQFLGALETEEMLARIKAARIFVHPSTKEGGGSITLLEANACGTPVLIYRHPNGIDAGLIEPGVNGWIVDQVTPDALADMLARLLAPDAILPSRAECARHAAAYDWDSLANQYEAVFLGADAAGSRAKAGSGVAAAGERGRDPARV